MIGAVTAVAVLGLAPAAFAHVTVNPSDAKQGRYTRVAFRVPTESDTASTTKLEVAIPTGSVDRRRPGRRRQDPNQRRYPAVPR